MRMVPYVKFRAIGSNLEGSPSIIEGDFICSYNNLTSLEGAPTTISTRLDCQNNKLTDLHNIHKQIRYIGEFAIFFDNPIKSHVLGLLLINGLHKVFLDNLKVDYIINKHLAGDRDVFACQEELIENGFEEFAHL